MEYRILGKLEVLRDGVELDLGTFRQRSLLSLLLSESNSVVSTDRIIDSLWGDSEGGDRQNSIWVNVSGLRKVLEPDRAKRADATVLVTRSPGYLIAAEPDEIDSVKFERLVGEGRLLAVTDPAAASLVFGEALGLWRGKAYEDISYESFIQPEIARLESLRQEAVEARISADLDRGMARELISELETLVRQHPLREELTGQHMLALARSGRQAEALRAYQALRTRLGEELGIEPSRQLRELEEQIVLGEVEAPRGASAVVGPGEGATGLGIRGYELRDQLGEGAFGVVHRAYQPAVGREVAIKVIRPEFANDPDFIRRFEAEAQLVARLEHPHIVPLYDYWREPDAAYLVMRLMSGGSLADRLEETSLEPRRAGQLLEQVASALHVAHLAGIVHRDIKPDNILLDDSGNAYLSDFGIAVEASERANSGSVLTTLGPPYASPEALEHHRGSVTSDIYSLGVVLAHALTGMRGEVESVRGALDASALRVIDRATDPVPTARFSDVLAMVGAWRSAMGTDVGDVASFEAELENPYMGLHAFDAPNSAAFFGRERLVERLVTRLGQGGTKGRFVAIVGPSGSGKSSVAKAGLIPAIRRDALVGSDDWFVVTMIPGAHPFEELEGGLRAVAANPPASLLEDLLAENGLHRAVSKLLPNDGSQLVLVIDQFEELFTLADADSANLFLDALAGAVTDKNSRLRVVLTLRADFYDRPLRHLRFGELLRDGTEVITPMTAEELERAIAGPAEAVGVRYESGLVAELIRDVADRAGALPLLQYTLTELFDARTTNTVTVDEYRALGGVSGALVSRAEGLFAQLGDHAHDAVRQVFLRLVTFGEGAEDTRRRVQRAELDQLTIDRQVLDGVLDTFGRHRLVSFDRDPVTRGPTVEISHEALLREWLRLRNWIDSARENVRSQRRLAESMAEWNAAGREPDFLLRGGRLDELRIWASHTDVPLSTTEQHFLDASIADADRQAEEEAERELRTVEAERVAQKRLRLLAGSALAGLVVAGLAIFGLSQWRSASVERDRATEARDEATQARNDRDSLAAAAEYVTASDTVLAEDPELALAYGIEAVRSTANLGFATEEAVDAVHWALQQMGVHFDLGPDPAATTRSGPYGLTGVFLMAPADLIDLGEASTSRRLTEDECLAVTEQPCGDSVEIPDDLPFRFGEENYRQELPTILPGTADGPLAGTSVSIAISSVFGGIEGLEQELKRFTDLTGIDVALVPSRDTEVALAVSGGSVISPPDVSVNLVPELPSWARERALDFSEFLDVDQVRSDFGDALTDLLMVDTDDGQEMQSIPVNVGPSGLVYYAKPAFEEAGYEIPSTFDGLVELSQQMVADGQTPWCFAWEASWATGFPGTDLLESLVIRLHGTEAYDRWVAGELDFASPEIIDAANEVERLFAPEFILGGKDSVTSRGWSTPFLELLDINPFTGAAGPNCMFIHQTHRAATFLGPHTDLRAPGLIGTDYGVFLLPPADETDPITVTGSGSLAFASSDRPEVRELIQYMANPEWGEVWAGWSADANEPFISANKRFLTDNYRLGRFSAADAATRVAIHEIQRSAIDAETWRWDGSDQMPARFATWAGSPPEPGPFLVGMSDWINEVQPIEEILADLDTARLDYS